MMPITTGLSERLQLKAWSKSLQANKVLSTYVTHSDSDYIDITPSPEMDGYFRALGLTKTAHGYELDMANAPLGTVAKAFGFNYDDAAVRNLVSVKTLHQPTSSSIAALASMGLGQLGTLESATYKSPATLEIDQRHVIELAAEQVPNKLYTTGKILEKELARTGVLIRLGKDRLAHGYLVTCDPGEQSNATDRLAIYAATMKSLSTIGGVEADTFVGFKLNDDGRPSALFIDSNRPQVKITDVKAAFREDRPTYLVVSGESLSAKYCTLPAGPYLRASTQKTALDYIYARHLKNLAQDIPTSIASTQFNAPVMSEGVMASGALSIPATVNLYSYLETSKASLKGLSSSIGNQARLYGHVLSETEKNHAKEEIKHLMIRTLEDSKQLYKDLNQLMKNHKLKESVRSSHVERPRPTREFDLMI